MVVDFQALSRVRRTKNRICFVTKVGYTGVLDCVTEADANFLVKKYQLLMKEGDTPVELSALIHECFMIYSYTVDEERGHACKIFGFNP